MTKIILFFSILLFNLTCLVADNVQNLSNKVNTLQFFKAHFEQIIFDDRGQIIDKSRGVVYLSKPEKFRWQYEHPVSQLIVANGKTIWIYDEDLEQVTIKKQAHVLSHTPASFLSGEDWQQSFQLLNATQYKTTEIFQLRPLLKENNFQEILLTFENNQLVTMNIMGISKQQTVLTFSNIEQNIRINPALFSFTPPDNVDIIDENSF